ncbi:multicopper oxidase domain-containing protein [Methylobacter sp.]|uniref:multicopper oxidase family protein n=1 Tax=Methylobacter sp. TaxID=2051955 RepID=UPI0012050CE9|nr:multicopper oxidase domain-containing protein [Methylobacter sp.]TAK61937.1 MAG: copper oxidase [Methylobacter sp.]
MRKKTTRKLAGLAIMGAMTAPLAVLADGAPLQLPQSVSSDPQSKSLKVELEVKSEAYTLTGPSPTSKDLTNPVVKARGIKLTDSKPTASQPNGLLVGPTLRIRPGDKFDAKLINSLSYSESEGDGSHSMTNPHGFDVINLHTHGLHVSPNSPSDNVLISIYPQDTPFTPLGQCRQESGKANCVTGHYKYSYAIPANHPSGTYWYHAHKHGAVSMHLADGFAGALIVEDPKHGLESLPPVKAAQEQILMLQEVQYDGDHKGDSTDPYQITCMSVYGNNTGCAFGGSNLPTPTVTNNAISVNGQFQPSISMRTNEAQLWRVINGTIGNVVPMCFLPLNGTTAPSPASYVLATDGVALQRPTTNTTDLPVLIGNTPVANPVNGNDILNNELLFLAAGQRLDLMVKAPTKPGTYGLYDSSVAGAGLPIGQLCQASAYTNATPILTVSVTESASEIVYNMAVPSQAELNKLTAPATITEEQSPQLPTQGVTYGFTTNTYADKDGGASVVNGRVFNPLRSQRNLALNQVDKWAIQSAVDTHMFHIHINSFQLVSRGQLKYPFPVWRDTLLVNCAGVAETNGGCSFPGGLTGATPLNNYGEVVQFLQQPLDYTGALVEHCHNVSHEDNGMMELVEILPSSQGKKGKSGNMHKVHSH